MAPPTTIETKDMLVFKKDDLSAAFSYFKLISRMFLLTCDETLSIVAVCVNNPDCSTITVHG